MLRVGTVADGAREAVIDRVLATVRRRRLRARPFILYVSGVDGAGKTEFASALARHARESGDDVQLVHLDDFHHPKAHRHAGGRDLADRYYSRSFDLDRLIGEVLEPIRAKGGLSSTLAVLDLDTDNHTAERSYRIGPGTLVILEGVFLARPELRPYCDGFVELDVPLPTAYDRALRRDARCYGDEATDRYAARFYPAQMRYRRACAPAQGADLVVDNRDPKCPRVVRARGMVEPFIRPGEVDAVCFDLWNTLVPLPQTVRIAAARATAERLGVDSEDFAREWRAGRAERECMPLEAFLERFCAARDVPASAEQRREAIAERMRLHARAMSQPREGAELTLRMLRAAGYRVGLVSNCTSDVPSMLLGSPLGGLFDATVFSFAEGLMKPDPRIYQRACEQLSASPARCLFVGDGNDEELRGASAAGLRPVLLETDERREFSGPRITSLIDLAETLVV